MLRKLMLMMGLVVALSIGAGVGSATEKPSKTFMKALKNAGLSYRVAPFPENADSVLITQPLSGSGLVEVRHVTRDKDRTLVYYDYTGEGKETQKRILAVHEKAHEFLVYAGTGEILSGYTFDKNDEDDLSFTYVQSPVLLTIDIKAGPSSPVTFAFVGKKKSSLVFDSMSDFGDAAGLLKRFDEETPDEGSLTSREHDLLKKARELRSWGPYFTIGLDGDELSAVGKISRDTLIVGSSETEPQDPADGDLAEGLCDIVTVAKKVCELSGVEHGLYKWALVLDAGCALYKEMIKISEESQ